MKEKRERWNENENLNFKDSWSRRSSQKTSEIIFQNEKKSTFKLKVSSWKFSNFLKTDHTHSVLSSQARRVDQHRKTDNKCLKVKLSRGVRDWAH